VDPINEIFRSLQPHPINAQILLEIEDQGETLEKALRILETNGFLPIDYDFIQKGNLSFVLFHFSNNDIKGAALHLTEAGFTRLKAISSKGANPNK